MLKDLLEVSRERIRNPFVSSFIIATVVLNWKLILFIALSDLPIRERIAFAEANYINWLDFMGYPLGIAVFYTLILPYLMLGIDHLLKTANTKKMKSYFALEISRTREKAELAREEVKLELIKADSSDLNRANEQIEQLKQVIEQKESSIQNLEEKYNALQMNHERLRSENINLVDKTKFDEFPDVWKFINNRDLLRVFEDLQTTFKEGIKSIRNDYVVENNSEIQELVRMGLISLGSNSNNKVGFKLTERGEKLLNRIEKAQQWEIKG